MHYVDGYNKFKTSRLGALWKNNIPSLDALKTLAATSAFVAIDMEPWSKGERRGKSGNDMT